MIKYGKSTPSNKSGMILSNGVVCDIYSQGTAKPLRNDARSSNGIGEIIRK